MDTSDGTVRDAVDAKTDIRTDVKPDIRGEDVTPSDVKPEINDTCVPDGNEVLDAYPDIQPDLDALPDMDIQYDMDALPDMDIQYDMDARQDINQDINDVSIPDTHDTGNDVNTQDVSADSGSTCPGGAGCTCTNDNDCNSGFCIETQKGFECAAPCDNNRTCPDGYTCVDRTDNNGNTAAICVYDFPRLCLPCTKDEECHSRYGLDGSMCIAWVPEVDDQGNITGDYLPGYGLEGAFCGSPCNTRADCPNGYDCKIVQSVEGIMAKQCALVVDSQNGVTSCGCSDKAKQEGLKGACYARNEFGTCEGTQACSANGMGKCSAQTPARETCNHQDDNCDGNTDEGFDLKTDVNNCGDCGIQCTNDHGTTKCENGKCVPTCDAGWVDCDNNPVNGCESTFDKCYSCTTNADCATGVCQSDFDGDGRWCASADQCVHDGKIYDDGEAVCKDQYTQVVCKSGKWQTRACAELRCSGDCGTGENGCVVLPREVCKAGKCVPGGDKVDTDKDKKYCDTCKQTWVDDACCGDDANEFVCNCQSEKANWACPKQYWMSCCDAATDCVDAKGNCVASGTCSGADSTQYVQKIKSYCDKGTWRDPDESQAFCEAKNCGNGPPGPTKPYVWLTFGYGANAACCGDDPGEDFNNIPKTLPPGAHTYPCCYNASVLQDGSASGAVLCYQGRLYNCNNVATDVDKGVARPAKTCDAVGKLYCHKDGSWGAMPAGCGTKECTTNADCPNGVCLADFDGVGKWCASANQCVHDGHVYNVGDKVCDATQKTSALCSGRGWTTHDCTWNVPTCYEGYCDAGECKQKPSDTTTLCNKAFACSPKADAVGYGTGGSFVCQGFCDGKGKCDWAGNCDNCDTKASVDSDGSPTAYKKPGEVMDYGSCKDGKCLFKVYDDTCNGTVLYEYGAKGSGHVETKYDCQDYEHDYCDQNILMHDEWGCATNTDNQGYCEDMRDTVVKNCGTNTCDVLCPLNTDYCLYTYHEKGCRDIKSGEWAECYDNAYDPDQDKKYCSGCKLSWALGGEVAADTCCGDDKGEYPRTCDDSSANGDCGKDTQACCDAKNDCVDAQGNCRTAGACYEFGPLIDGRISTPKSYCDDNGQWQDPDEFQAFCEAKGCGYTWLPFGIGKGARCCGDDYGEDFNNQPVGVPHDGQQYSCCYNATVLPDSIPKGAVLCSSGHLYNCEGVAQDVTEGVATKAKRCQKVGNWYCYMGKWYLKLPPECLITPNQ